MNLLIHFDIAALIILVIILCTNLYRKMYKDMSSVVFTVLVISTICSATFECAQIIMYAAGCRNDIAFTIVKTLYILFHNFAPLVYFLYCISIARTWHRMQQHPIITLLMALPFFIITALYLVNPFFSFLFTFENGVEVMRVSWVQYAVSTFYVAATIVHIIRNRKLFKRHQILALASMIPLTILTVIVDSVMQDTLISVFSNTVGILIMSTVIQRPELVIDTTTLLKKFSLYTDDMSKAYNNGNHLTVIMINIENYDYIYRLMGYDATARLLKKIADRLNELNIKYRAFANCYYLDRGRFRVTVNSFNTDKIRPLAYAINEMLKDKLTVKNIDITPNAYVCVARCPEDLADFPTLMNFGADFHTKIQNSGDVIIAEELLKQREFSLINHMDDIVDRALDHGNLRVYYQPIYSVNEKRFTSAEALLRLIDEEHGFVPPDLFIPAAEKNGTIHKIGAFVLDEVCRFIASDRYKELGLDYIEINLSAAQCIRSDLAEQVLKTIRRHNVDVSQINLEITETAANYNMSMLTENMRKLTEAGVSFSLDDFGTGYSNMERVASLPLKIVKLDRTFVNSQHKPKMCIFLENFIKMFKRMDMEIVVEGIETDQMLRRFSDLKCDFIQGYYFSKPIPEDDFVEFIKQHKVEKVQAEQQ